MSLVGRSFICTFFFSLLNNFCDQHSENIPNNPNHTMPSVIKDYYNSNDYNGLFSWLLYNIRHGEFEELNNNLLKKELLRRFITHYFTTTNDMVLLVSIPDTILEKGAELDPKNNKHYFLQQINKQKTIDFKILENFLKDYFHLDSLNNICIKKLVTYIEDKRSSSKYVDSKKSAKINITNNCVVYNNEVHYLISDPIHGFKNDDWLGLKKYNTDTVDKPAEQEALESLATTSKSDDSDILEIDFKHPSEMDKSNCNNKKKLIMNAVEDQKKAAKADDVVNREYMDSINSYNYSTDDSFGTELEPVETRQSDDSSCDIDDISIGDLSSYASDNEMASIFPSISIKDESTDMQFRLVLQSIIIIKPNFDGSSYTMHTAIRQSNYLPYVASVEDDWLLYDEKFDIKNLQMCSLNDIWISFRNSKKILFYSLVDTGRENTLVTHSEDELEQEEDIVPFDEEIISDDDEVDDLASFDSNEMNPHSLTVSDEINGSKEFPQQIYDNGDDSEHGIQLYQANTNVTNPLNLRKTNTGATLTQNFSLKKHLTLSSYNPIERSNTISQNGLVVDDLDFATIKRTPTASSTKKVNKDNNTYLKMIKGNRKSKVKVSKDADDKNCIVM